MSGNKILDTMWDDNPIDITQEANFIWSIANKLRGSYMPDKYGDVVIPMTILRRFECALADTKKQVVDAHKKNPNYPAKALCKISGFSFYNTSEYDLKELCNDPNHIAANFKNYISGFSSNVKDIFGELEMSKHIDKMEKDGCLYSVVEAFSVLDLSIKTYDSIKMGYIFENLIGRFYQNVDAGQFYTGRDIIKLLVEILMAEGCDDIFDSHKVITVLDQACGTGGMLSTAYTYIKHYNPTAEVKLFGQEFMGQSYAVGLAEMLIKIKTRTISVTSIRSKRIALRTQRCVLCLKTRRLALRGRAKTQKTGRSKPCVKSMQKARWEDGDTGFRAVATLK